MIPVSFNLQVKDEIHIDLKVWHLEDAYYELLFTPSIKTFTMKSKSKSNGRDLEIESLGTFE